MAKKKFPPKVKRAFGSKRAVTQAVMYHRREKLRARRAS